MANKIGAKTKSYLKYLENKEEIITLYRKGYTSKELQKIYSIGRQCLVKYLKRDGIKTRVRGETTDRQIYKVKETMLKKYGVENPGQINNPLMQKEKSKKISKYKKENGSWKGKDNPNYGNKIGNNFGFKTGYREDLPGVFFRSSWEANFARILNHLKIKWIHEPTHFPLNNGESYTPDFYLPDYNAWIEVKGFWFEDAKSKFERFRNLYNLRIILVEEKEYKWFLSRYKNTEYLEG